MRRKLKRLLGDFEDKVNKLEEKIEALTFIAMNGLDSITADCSYTIDGRTFIKVQYIANKNCLCKHNIELTNAIWLREIIQHNDYLEVYAQDIYEQKGYLYRVYKVDRDSIDPPIPIDLDLYLNAFPDRKKDMKSERIGVHPWTII